MLFTDQNFLYWLFQEQDVWDLVLRDFIYLLDIEGTFGTQTLKDLGLSFFDNLKIRVWHQQFIHRYQIWHRY